jgi:uncharacterized membrane protein YhaH (DUF805 family)
MWAQATFTLLTSFKGRIGRSSWWLGFALVVTAALAGSFAIDPGVWFARPSRAPSGPLAVWFLVLVAPMTALSVKRFNDRDRPWWWGYAMGGLGAAMIIAEQAGFMVDQARVTAPERAVLWIACAPFVLAFVDNAFLRGTPGFNRYGPAPQG